jgi:cell division protein FtsN
MPARKRRKRQTTNAAPGWAWMLVGLSIGLAVALVVYLQSGRPSTTGPTTAARPLERPRLPLPEPAERLPSPTPSANTARGQAGESDNATDSENGAAQPATDDRAQSASQFEFYESLADFEVVVPQSEFEERAALQPAAADPTQRYLIQAGSFRASADADSRKANLALLGIESWLQRANLDDGVFHRVMIGPITGQAEYDRLERRLKDANIPAFGLVLTDD